MMFPPGVAPGSAVAVRLTEMREEAYARVMKCIAAKPYDNVRPQALGLVTPAVAHFPAPLSLWDALWEGGVVLQAARPHFRAVAGMDSNPNVTGGAIGLGAAALGPREQSVGATPTSAPQLPAEQPSHLLRLQERSRLLTELREELFVDTDVHLEILTAGQRGEIPSRIEAAAAARCGLVPQRT